MRGRAAPDGFAPEGPFPTCLFVVKPFSLPFSRAERDHVLTRAEPNALCAGLPVAVDEPLKRRERLEPHGATPV